jgi:acyl phosphate:glycerol-3-phosphate acyltransferase
MTRWLPLIMASYLVGSLSFSLLAVWLLRRVDLRSVGSGNPGATNVLRAAGSWPALAVLLLDIAKGLVPVQIAKRLEAPTGVVAGVAFAAVVGHVFPLYFGFRGGKGVATGFGAFVGLFPLAAGMALVAFVATAFATRYVSVASLVGAATVPAAAWLLGRGGWTSPASRPELAFAIATAALIFARHRSNLRRLAAGAERHLGESPS